MTGSPPISSESNIHIHHTALVDPAAVIGRGTTIGAYSIIGPNVILGENNRIASHVVIEGRTRIGSGNQFFQFCSIGSIPQDLKYRGEDSVLEIGNQNIIREYVTIQPGTSGGGMLTSIGDKNLFMANSHLGHDGHIEHSNVIANSAAIAGHVSIGSFTIVGGLAAIHQFVRIGDHCILGGGAMVTQDIPPFCVCQGDRAKLHGINVVGLERRGISSEQIRDLKLAYRKLFLGKGVIKERIAEISSEFSGDKLIQQLCDFLASADRGVARASRVTEDE